MKITTNPKNIFITNTIRHLLSLKSHIPFAYMFCFSILLYLIVIIITISSNGQKRFHSHFVLPWLWEPAAFSYFCCFLCFHSRVEYNSWCFYSTTFPTFAVNFMLHISLLLLWGFCLVLCLNLTPHVAFSVVVKVTTVDHAVLLIVYAVVK